MADISWGASFGSQLLAEISLLEANARQQNVNNVDNGMECQQVNIPASDSFNGNVMASLPKCETSENRRKTDTPLFRSPINASAASILLNGNFSSSEMSAIKFDKSTSFGKKKDQSIVIHQSFSNASISMSLNGNIMSSDPSGLKMETSTNFGKNSNLKPTPSQSPLSCSTPVASLVFNFRRASLRSGSSLKLKLENWQLPDAVVKKYSEKKITDLFPWQVECLLTGKVLNGGNLIYSAPTSSGKTLVSELLMLKTVFERKKKGLYILPFVAVAKEKTRVLKAVTEDVGVRVESFAGSSNPPGGLKNCDLAICTIEKANSMINRLIEEGTLNQIGIVVVDEMHLIGDSHRGYLLELLLTKILYASARSSASSPIQLIGMSATLPNLEVLCKWLRADIFRTDFRPIPLKEHIKIGSEIFTPDLVTPIRKIEAAQTVPNDADHVVFLSLEPVLNGHSVLIFCPAKNWCEKMAENISNEFCNLGSDASSSYGMKLREQLNGQHLAQVLVRLKASPAGLDSVLGRTIRFAVAFHHAGLTSEERDIIEAAFRNGVIRVLVATSTLSSGVNLPARRVIIRTPMFHGSVIDPLVYRQMIGRAGRFGEDTDGESFLICQPNEKHSVMRMFAAQPQPLKSCLLIEQAAGAPCAVSSSLKRAMLEVIATGSASTTEDLKLYASCTLLAVLNNVPEEALNACLSWLVGNEFIRRQTVGDGERLTPTQLGLACLASSLSPDESLVLLGELQTARKGLILDSDLHLVYQITPTYVSDQMTQIDWLHYLTLWEELDSSQKRVGEAVGVEERFLVRAMKGTVSNVTPRQYRQLAIHRRFYTALALHQLMNEVRLSEVAQNYKMNKGTLQSLQQQTATFAGMVTIFCQRLGWNSLHVLLQNFQSRLLFGVQLELCDLLRLPSMESHTARLLYDAGLVNISSVATASRENIEVLLKNARPFETAQDIKGKKDENVADAQSIIAEARKLIQLELGVKIQWNEQLSIEKIVETKHVLEKPKLVPSQPRKPTPTPQVTPAPRLLTPPQVTPPRKVDKKEITMSPDMFNSSSQSGAASESFRHTIVTQQKDNLLRTPLTKAVESLCLSDGSFDSMCTPNFAACAEQLIPVTEHRPPPPEEVRQCVKRQISINDSSILEATPPPPNQHQSIGRLVAKKSKLSSPEPTIDCSFMSDDSSIIPSSLPATQPLDVNEITTLSRLDSFLKESLHQSDGSLSVSVYKEKNCILGLVVVWCSKQVHYIRLRENLESDVNHAVVKRLKSWLESLARSKIELVVYDIRAVTKDLRILFQHSINELLFRDVDLAQWLLDPSAPSATLQKLAKMYCSAQQQTQSSNRGRAKVLHDCRSLLTIFNQLRHRLIEVDLWTSFVEVEMPSVAILLRMEQVGIGFDRAECESTLRILREHIKILEEKAHLLAGRSFSLTSSKETSKVIAQLNLVIPEEKSIQSFINPLKNRKKFQAPVSVTKAALVKLVGLHPLPSIIVEYRKITAIVQQIICPLLQASTFHLGDSERIAGECEFRNLTGRVNIVQPNLQHIPRPFDLSDNRTIQVRNAFVAIPGSTLLSADYSQLELRILAHLSSDKGLCAVLSRRDGDVFRSIAAAWKKKKNEQDVSDEERQQAKQICYGIIYGMGCKSLADQLQVTEEEAQLFVDSFHDSYPSIKKFIEKTINECRSQGYVLTIHSRRRFLPSINSSNSAHRSQAERQAVNTKIQGSAADLVKSSLVLLDRTLRGKMTDVQLIHQIHDELLFQVPSNNLGKAAAIVRQCMETAIPMKIRLPVSLKSGPSWGLMKNLETK